MKPAYYNEIDPYCVDWLKNLIAAGLIPDGEVDSRSIVDVRADELRGFGQKHFFAGIGGFAYACRLAGWPDDADIATGGFPCQPFSVAGRQLAAADDRHLWPELHRLIAQCRPAAFLGENVAGIIGLALDGVQSDLETAGYASRAFVVPACAVDAPNRRDRVWILARHLADAAGARPLPSALAGVHGGEAGAGARHGEPERRGSGSGGDVGDSERGGQQRDARRRAGEQPADADGGGAVGDADGAGSQEHPRQSGDDGAECAAAVGAGGCGDVGDADEPFASDGGLQRRGQLGRAGGYQGGDTGRGFWDDAAWISGRDGKARRVPVVRVRGLADGLPGGVHGLRPRDDAEEVRLMPLLSRGEKARVQKLKALGNAINPHVAAEILRAMRVAP